MLNDDSDDEDVDMDAVRTKLAHERVCILAEKRTADPDRIAFLDQQLQELDHLESTHLVEHDMFESNHIMCMADEFEQHQINALFADEDDLESNAAIMHTVRSTDDELPCEPENESTSEASTPSSNVFSMDQVHISSCMERVDERREIRC